MRGLLALGLLVVGFGAFAADPPATEASIRKLIEVAQMRKLMDGMMSQVDAVMQNSMKQAAGSTTFTPQQQAVVDDMRKKMVVVLTEEMKWDTLEPEFIAIYRKTFTEQEMVGMLEFYQTKAGQALITKMPLVMQYSMELMQKRMASITPKLQQIQREAVERVQRAGG